MGVGPLGLAEPRITTKEFLQKDEVRSSRFGFFKLLSGQSFKYLSSLDFFFKKSTASSAANAEKYAMSFF